MDENKEAKVEEQKKTEAPFVAGEKGFAVFLLLIGLFFTYQSVLLWQRYPGISACAAVPLFVSVLIVIFAVAILIIDRNKDSVNHGKSVGEIVKATFTYIFPRDVLVIMGLVLLYCIGLYLGFGFYVCTPIFLWVGMSYLLHKDYVKNLLWTALCMAFILVIFTYLFSVVLP